MFIFILTVNCSKSNIMDLVFDEGGVDEAFNSLLVWIDVLNRWRCMTQDAVCMLNSSD